MKNIMVYTKLSNYCSWDQTENLDRILSQNVGIDLTYNNGIYFRLSIKHNNTKTLNSLLQYYEQTNLKGDFESIEYKVAKHKLQQILQDAINTFTPSKEIQEVLEKYLPKEEDSDSEQELEDIIMPTLNAGIITTELTEDSLRKFEAETKEINSTKIIENLLGFDTKEIQHSIEEDTTNINVDLSGDNIQKVH
jgi:hypothetical protein